MKTIPMRKCCATQTHFPKKHLLRIVRTPTGEVKLDLTGKVNGRGAYISNRKEALQKAMASKVLEKNLRTEIPQVIYQQLAEFCTQ